MSAPPSAAAPAIDVVPVTEEHWEQLSALFATSKGVDGCWCMWPLRPPRTHRPGRRRNRAAMRAQLRSGRPSPGLIAIRRGRAVGWCALGPRDRYPQYEKSRDGPRGGSSVWAIPCLYIEPRAPRRAVARALLEAAAAAAASNGAAVIEGPPPWWLPGDADAIARATRTFIENGFTRHAPGPRMPVLRRSLAG